MRFSFSDFVLDTDRFTVERGGQRVPMRPMVLDLLIYLVNARDRVVRREELVDILWRGMAVGPGSLSGLVNELRKAFREGRGAASSIRTVHARGYQFVAKVAVEKGTSGSNSSSGAEEGATADRQAPFGDDVEEVAAGIDAMWCRGAGGIRLVGDSEVALRDVASGVARVVTRQGGEVLRIDRVLSGAQIAHRWDPEEALSCDGGKDCVGVEISPQSKVGVAEFVAVLRRISQDAPLLVLIGDPQDGPVGCASFWTELLSKLGESRVILLGESRATQLTAKGDGTMNPGSELWTHPRVHSHRLRARGASALRALLSSAGFDGVPDALLDAIASSGLDHEGREPRLPPPNETETRVTAPLRKMRVVRSRDARIEAEPGTRQGSNV